MAIAAPVGNPMIEAMHIAAMLTYNDNPTISIKSESKVINK